jgi:DNA polymerase III sliding clamp (beta) subunit (PCNA family)
MVIWPDYPNFPKVAEHDYTVTVKGNKKVLIDTFKALAGRHEFNRVIMEADEGVFTIKGGDSGAAKVDVTCEGRGSLPVNATYLAKVLTTVDGVNATIQYSDAPSLVRVVGDKNPWPIRLAPMK